MGYRSEYFLILNGSIYVDCCAAMRAKLGKEWDVLVLRYTPEPETPIRHCGLDCLKE